jgi:hypothetical protein
MNWRTVVGGAVAAAGLLVPRAADATTLRHMNLGDMAQRSDRIFRGTVLGAKTGTVSVGGGALPTVTYRVRVDEPFKGAYPEAKGDVRYVEIRMVAAKDTVSGAVRHVSLFRDVPTLQIGQEYVLFTTRPSAVGLSTTVGLGQGAFGIYGAGKDEQVVNRFGNAGLGRDLPGLNLPSQGPVPYAQLARAIRTVLGQEGGVR